MNSKELVICTNPKSSVAESIRMLRTNLEFSFVDNDVNAVMITSSIAKEGKSFVAANLACAFGVTKRKTLLVDCDLRKGRIERIFGLKNRPGLSNLLLDDIYAYQDYIYTTDIDNLSVLPIGIVPPNPSELLGSEKCQILFRYLKQEYDLIILDCPPIADVADALVLSKIADEAVIVCAANYTPADELTSTKKALEQSGIKIAGVVVNKVEKDKKKRY